MLSLCRYSRQTSSSDPSNGDSKHPNRMQSECKLTFSMNESAECINGICSRPRPSGRLVSQGKWGTLERAYYPGITLETGTIDIIIRAAIDRKTRPLSTARPVRSSARVTSLGDASWLAGRRGSTGPQRGPFVVVRPRAQWLRASQCVCLGVRAPYVWVRVCSTGIRAFAIVFDFDFELCGWIASESRSLSSGQWITAVQVCRIVTLSFYFLWIPFGDMMNGYMDIFLEMYNLNILRWNGEWVYGYPPGNVQSLVLKGKVCSLGVFALNNENFCRAENIVDVCPVIFVDIFCFEKSDNIIKCLKIGYQFKKICMPECIPLLTAQLNLHKKCTTL